MVTVFSDNEKFQQDVDIIKDVYEGGLKTWECSVDMANFIKDFYFGIKLKNLRILELGCGSALPTISLLNRKDFSQFGVVSKVVLQDYNVEVLEKTTKNNILKFVPETHKQKITFFPGSWENFTISFCKCEYYDILLSSETIYDSNKYDEIIKIIENCLSHNNGIAMFLAKNFYFGIGLGGNVFDFISMLNLNLPQNAFSIELKYISSSNSLVIIRRSKV